MLQRHPTSTLFPYTTLFRSSSDSHGIAQCEWLPATVQRRNFTERDELHDAGEIASLKDRKSTRLNYRHRTIPYAGFCLKKKKINQRSTLVHKLQQLENGTTQ